MIKMEKLFLAFLNMVTPLFERIFLASFILVHESLNKKGREDFLLRTTRSRVGNVFLTSGGVALIVGHLFLKIMVFSTDSPNAFKTMTFCLD